MGAGIWGSVLLETLVSVMPYKKEAENRERVFACQSLLLLESWLLLQEVCWLNSVSLGRVGERRTDCFRSQAGGIENPVRPLRAVWLLRKWTATP